MFTIQSFYYRKITKFFQVSIALWNSNYKNNEKFCCISWWNFDNAPIFSQQANWSDCCCIVQLRENWRWKVILQWGKHSSSLKLLYNYNSADYSLLKCTVANASTVYHFCSNFHVTPQCCYLSAAFWWKLVGATAGIWRLEANFLCWIGTRCVLCLLCCWLWLSSTWRLLASSSKFNLCFPTPCTFVEVPFDFL